MLMPAPSEQCVCPRCRGFAYRTKRRLRDRLVSIVKPVKRYRCDYCGWSGAIQADLVPTKAVDPSQHPAPEQLTQQPLNPDLIPRHEPNHRL
jgi:hypothetical protein